MFGRKKKDKEKVTPSVSYQIVGHSGIRDGVVLKPREPFTRSWTVLNAASNQREKGRVVKLIHSRGEMLKDQLLFLWPVPGKTVTFSLDLVAPDTPGSYESFWTVEGASQADFWVKFKVEIAPSHLASSISLPGNMNALSISKIKKEINSPRRLHHDPSTVHTKERKKKKKKKQTSSSDPKVDRKSRMKSHLKNSARLKGVTQKKRSAESPSTPQFFRSRSLNSAETLAPADEASPLVRVHSGDSVSVMSQLFISDVIRTKQKELLPAVVDISGTTIDGISIKEKFGKEEQAVQPETKKFKFSGKRRKRKRADSEKREVCEEEYYLQRRCVSDNSSEIPKEGNREENEIAELDVEEKQDKQDKHQTASKPPELVIKDFTSKLLQVPISGKRLGSPSLVERWQETITNQSSQELAKQELAKQKKIQELSMSMQEIRRRLPSASEVNSRSKGNSPSLPSCFDQDVLASSRRLNEFIRNDRSKANSVAPLVTAQHSISEFISLGMQLEDQLNLLHSKYPDQNILSANIGTSLTHLQQLLPVLNKTNDEIKMTRQRILGNRNIGGLDDAIWLHIFSFLTFQELGRISCVCRDWDTLSKHDSLWSSKSLRLHNTGEKLLSEFGQTFEARRICKIESIYDNWFDSSTRWQKEDSRAMDDFSFNWPVYDLEIVDSTLVTVSDCLRVFDLKRNKSQAVLAGHHKVVNSVKLANNGKTCITGSVDKTVKIWSLVSKECWRTLEGHTGPITGVQQSFDMIISTCVQDKTVRFWRKKTGECVNAVKSDDPVSCLAINLTEANHNIYFGHSSGCVSAWDLETQREVERIKVSERSIESLQVFDRQFFASDYSQIFMNSFDGEGISCVSQSMPRNVGRLQYDGYKLGAHIGNRLEIFDLRYLFNDYSQVIVDNLWKGAFQFNDDYILIGGGNGKTNKWYPK